jgi:hypothetical protein
MIPEPDFEHEYDNDESKYDSSVDIPYPNVYDPD